MPRKKPNPQPNDKVTPEQLFDIGISEAQLANVYRNKSQTSIKWYLNLVRSFPVAQITRSDFTNQKREKNSMSFGKLYCYVYDAKTKDELPYWDKFPLVFPISPTEKRNGFYGLNLHYIPIQIRNRFLYTLYKIMNNTRYDNTTKLKLSYDYILSLGSFDQALAKVAFKHYLLDHVKSYFIYIEPDEWPIAMYLPMENWQKQSMANVYSDIQQQIKKLQDK